MGILSAEKGMGCGGVHRWLSQHQRGQARVAGASADGRNTLASSPFPPLTRVGTPAELVLSTLPHSPTGCASGPVPTRSTQTTDITISSRSRRPKRRVRLEVCEQRPPSVPPNRIVVKRDNLCSQSDTASIEPDL